MTTMMTVNFRGTELYGFHRGDEVVVAVKPIVEALGLDWAGQLQRIKRDPVLSKGMGVITIPFGRGGPQKSICLKLNLLNGWLFKIDANRVRPEIRQRVLDYQEECYEVLHMHFSDEGARLVQQEHERESLSLRLVNECRQIYGNRAAAELWKERGLPIVPAMQTVFSQGDLFLRG